MTNSIPWDKIIELIAKFPKGASLEEIMLVLTPTISRRIFNGGFPY
jgi:hypothetical protein